MKLIIFDVETTGLIAETDRIVEFGAVTLHNSKEISSFNRIIRPYRRSCFVPFAAEKVHGISKEMIERDGVLWSTIGQEIFSILNESDTHCAFKMWSYAISSQRGYFSFSQPLRA